MKRASRSGDTMSVGPSLPGVPAAHDPESSPLVSLVNSGMAGTHGVASSEAESRAEFETSPVDILALSTAEPWMGDLGVRAPGELSCEGHRASDTLREINCFRLWGVDSASGNLVGGRSSHECKWPSAGDGGPEPALALGLGSDEPSGRCKCTQAAGGEDGLCFGSGEARGPGRSGGTEGVLHVGRGASALRVGSTRMCSTLRAGGLELLARCCGASSGRAGGLSIRDRSAVPQRIAPPRPAEGSRNALAGCTDIWVDCCRAAGLGEWGAL